MNLDKYTKKLKVLYVEDDETLLLEVKELFSNFFDDIVTATNGKDGFEIYKKEHFDIVISDIKMPKLDGIELSKKIKEINKDQEIIIISAYNESDKLLELLKIGVSDFILKPMEYEQLINTLYKVSKNVYYKKENTKFLIQQSKMAQMGEMMDMIAHQWLQFVNVISMQTELLNIENKQGILDKNKIETYAKETLEEIEELNEVLNEFRSFFKSKPKESVDLKYIVKNSLLLIKDYLIKNLVEYELDLNSYITEIYPNEFKHVIINVITNMVDEFNHRNIENRYIKIYNNKNVLYIEDNAGGIDENIIDSIFEDNFTTKENGSGKGLYLSKLIMEKIGGDIKAENIENGARFIIKVGNGN